MLKWFYSLPSVFCTSISILCFKYSFCISNIHSNCFFTDEEIVKVTSCKSLKNGKAMDPEGYINELFNSCGYDLRNSLKLLCNKMKSQKAVPSNWENISITTIFKRKGSKKELKNHRGILLTPIVSKIFEKLIKLRIDPCINDYLSDFQAGGKANRSTADNIFLLRSLIDHDKEPINSYIIRLSNLL